MGNTVFDFLVAAYQRPDPHPYLYQKGQWVRVLKSVTDDGQTPREWAGALAIVEHRKTTGLHKDHIYLLANPRTGQRDEFREEELDRRYVLRRPSPRPAPSPQPESEARNA